MNDTQLQLERLSDELLLAIRRRPTVRIGIEKLSQKFLTDPATIRDAARLLISLGYRIKLKKSELIFLSAPDSLTQNELGYKLKSKIIGQNIFCYNAVKSTNDIASLLASDGATEGTLVTAEQQTKGRGRHGRSWHSPPGTGIYMSIILRPKIRPELAPGLSIIAALALAETLEPICPGEIKIKWPNDLLIGKRKVAGILTELTADKGKTDFVVVGIGINVNQGISSFPEEIRARATSLRRATKRKVARVALVQNFLVRFEKQYLAFISKGLVAALPKVRKYSSLLGEPVTVRAGQKKISGIAESIDQQGRLLIRTDTDLIPVSAGEVTVER